MTEAPKRGDWLPPRSIDAGVVDIQHEAATLTSAADKLKLLGDGEMRREIGTAEALVAKASRNFQIAVIDHRRHKLTHPDPAIPNGDLSADYYYGCLAMAEQNHSFAISWFRKTLRWAADRLARENRKAK